MRKGIYIIVALIASFLATSDAKAQTEINLAASTSGTITFNSGGSDTATMALSDVSGQAPASTTGSYTMAFPTNSTITLTETNPVTMPGLYMASNTATSFTVMNYDGMTGSLTGTFTVVSLLQGGTGAFINQDPTAVVNFVVTSASGALSSWADAASGILTLNLKLPSSTAIDELTGPETATITDGDLTPSPEPAALLLFGTGLLAIAGLLRRGSSSI